MRVIHVHEQQGRQVKTFLTLDSHGSINCGTRQCLTESMTKVGEHCPPGFVFSDTRVIGEHFPATQVRP